jgi:DegT/DnrJ/EryC1/StrS aminotransferase family
VSTATAANPVLPLAATEGTRVPFIRLDSAFPELFAELMEVVERIAGKSAFTLGPELERFEEAFASFCGTEHAVGVSSGTAALEIALRALGVGPGDEVIVPTYSFIATAEAVSTVGATPVIVDVDPETALITAETVTGALTPRTRCVIPVHLFGRPVEMDPLLALCRERDIAVVEDACQAHGALYRGRPVGSFGDVGCFSFYPTKNLGGWGDGGAVVTSDPELDHKVRLLRSHGEGTRHHHELATGTHRLDTLQAAPPRGRRGAARGAGGQRCRLPRSGDAGQRPRLPPLRRPLRRARCAARPPRQPRDRQRDPLPDADPPPARLRPPRPRPRQPAGGGAARLRKLLPADLPCDRGLADRGDRRGGREF